MGLAYFAVPGAFVKGMLVMLSTGVAAFLPGSRTVTSEGLLREADKAVYAAKSGGRNAVVAADTG
jgi:PleD family two-component response regulator